MTKVLVRSWRIVPFICCLLAGSVPLAQSPSSQSSLVQSGLSQSGLSQSGPPDCPQTTSGLYTRLRTVGLDPTRVFHVREASINRPNLSLTLDDGTLAFTQDVCGRITGAFFIGDGEILVQPPNSIERASLTLFTGMAILEEQFNSAYLRFNDDTAESLQSFLTLAIDPVEFIKDWNDTAQALAGNDSMRLFLDFSHFLPAAGPASVSQKFPSLLHLRLTGKKLGTFEVFYDSAIAEPLWVGQLRSKDNSEFFDIWTSFTPPSAAESSAPAEQDISIPAFRIRATVHPPVELQGSTEMDVRIRKGGDRTVLFELSRYLKVDSVVSADGHPLDFIQNTALKGTDLARRGNDFVAVIFPAELTSGQELKLRFHYAGDVLSDAGNGLLYVGARGSWYPNFGLSPASFDMEFHYPAAWTLIATGKRVAASSGNPSSAPGDAQEKVARWVSEHPIPVAGFNLGKYVRAEAKAGKVVVEAYGTKGVEKAFPKAPAEIVQDPSIPTSRSRLNPSIPMVIVPPEPSPAHEVQNVADRAAKAVDIFSRWFGPFPYSSLSLTQMPGQLSQGWPSLVFLSSFAFLTPQEQIDLKLDPVTRELSRQVLVHETAHQWWGDLVLWKSYHDQWISEALANYAAFLILERQNPEQFRDVMEKYRNDLLSKNQDGEWVRDAGPVTLGQRLTSSHFPNGYEAISYERGTWLMHMLRCMMRDAELVSPHQGGVPKAEEPFLRALRKVRERYAGKAISTHDLVKVFEEELPRPLWYDSRHKLDWFVDSWIDGTAIPQLETRDIRISEKERTITVSGFIVQKDAPGDLITAVPVYGETSSNSMIFLGEVLADGPETAFHFTAPSSLRKILLDPKQTILTAPK